MNHVSSNRIEWTVPFKWHVRKVLAELRGVYNLRSLTRIVLVSLTLCLGIWYLAERALGPLEFNWIRAIALSVLAGIGIVFVGAATAFMPPTIRISEKGIDVFSGRNAFRAAFKDLDALGIERSVPAVLVFHKGKRAFRYAIAESMDLEQLRHELERLSGRSVQMLEESHLEHAKGAAN